MMMNVITKTCGIFFQEILNLFSTSSFIQINMSVPIAKIRLTSYSNERLEVTHY